MKGCEYTTEVGRVQCYREWTEAKYIAIMILISTCHDEM